MGQSGMRSSIRSVTAGEVAVGLVILALGLGACSMAPYRYEPLDATAVTQRAIAQEQGAFVVRASVPGEEEARKIFGFPIYKRGIQPVWLEISNTGSKRARVILSSIDEDYFSPLEVAYMHKKHFSKEGWLDMEKYLHASALPRQIAPNETASGFVFTHTSNGTKAFNLDIFYAEVEPEYEQFTFFVEVPGFVPDHASVDFRNLYRPEEIRTVDRETLPELLGEIPCCTTNHDGSAQGRPAQLFFVADPLDLLRALLRAGWNETSYARDATYQSNADYLFGRPPDAIFRKGRDKTTERAELGLWLAPAIVDGKALWVGQFKHAIGRRYAVGELFLGVTLDPDANDGRNYVLQDLWYAQSLQHWAWSDSGKLVPQDAPESDFHGNLWFSVDSYRLALWVSGAPVDLAAATPIDWGEFQPLRDEQP
jgi:hypothetical protein